MLLADKKEVGAVGDDAIDRGLWSFGRIVEGPDLDAYAFGVAAADKGFRGEGIHHIDARDVGIFLGIDREDREFLDRHLRVETVDGLYDAVVERLYDNPGSGIVIPYGSEDCSFYTLILAFFLLDFEQEAAASVNQRKDFAEGRKQFFRHFAAAEIQKVESAERVEGHSLYAALAVGGAVYRRVVADDKFAVGGHMYVDFDHIRTEFDSVRKAGYGIFGAEQRAAAMGYYGRRISLPGGYGFGRLRG